MYDSGKRGPAAGGCGSAYLPLGAIDPERTQLLPRQFRILVTTEYAEFDNFREGDDSVTNPGGNRAIISLTTLFLDYGVSDRITASLLIPYVNKEQNTKKFGKRVAKGIGDVSVFGRYEVVAPDFKNGPSIALGLGLKFPTGDIDEPNQQQLLPPPFQVGSDAFDLVPTVSYYHDFGNFLLFGDAFARIPLEENKRGYKFGREYEGNLGMEYPLGISSRKVSLLLGMSFLYGERDRDYEFILPGRLRDGAKVLNTGGRFLDIVPGIRVHPNKALAFQLRFAIPVVEDWNGDRSRNVGQVAPDFTTQFTVAYSIN